MMAWALVWMARASGQECTGLEAVVDGVEGLVAVGLEQHGETVFLRHGSRGATRGRGRDGMDGRHDVRSAGKSIAAPPVHPSGR
jgi:hypothetical protein